MTTRGQQGRHPGSAELIAFLETGASSPAEAALRDHLRRACRRCHRRLDLYRLLIGSLREGPLPEAPHSVVEAAIELFSHRRRPARPRRKAVELLARLLFDSGRVGMRLAPAVRAIGTERRLRFEGGGVELDVLLRPEPAGLQLIAQAIVGPGDPQPLAHGPYVVRQGSRILGEGRCDAFGEFRLDLPQGPGVQIVLDHRGVPVRFDLPA